MQHLLGIFEWKIRSKNNTFSRRLSRENCGVCKANWEAIVRQSHREAH